MGKTRVYVGESHRSFWDRACEHDNALKEKDEWFGVVKHWMEEHPELLEPPKYEYKVLKSHRTSLERQIAEALEISATDAATPLNTKTE